MISRTSLSFAEAVDAFQVVEHEAVVEHGHGPGHALPARLLSEPFLFAPGAVFHRHQGGTQARAWSGAGIRMADAQGALVGAPTGLWVAALKEDRGGIPGGDGDPVANALEYG